jgi:hypothetical protein
MKDFEMHGHLVEPELREFFSFALSDVMNGEIEYPAKFSDEIEANLRSRIPDKFRYLRRKEILLKQAQKEVELAQKDAALDILLKERGWQWFDVSEYVQNTTGRLLGRPFVGSEKDYDALMDYIKDR